MVFYNEKCNSVLNRDGYREKCHSNEDTVATYVIYGGIASLKAELCPIHANRIENSIEKHWRMTKLMEVNFRGDLNV